MLKRWINRFHYLSFDVAIGVFIQALAIQKFTKFIFSQDYFILLSLTTLTIYWLDRLLDVRKIKEGQLYSEKHRFYKKNEKILWFICIVTMIFLGVKGLFFANQEVKKLGIIGGICVTFYLFIHHFFKGEPCLIFFKELMIALTYSLILWILPLLNQFYWINFLSFLCLFCNALLNLWIISVMDYELDCKLGVHSFAQYSQAIKAIQLGFWLTLMLILWLMTAEFCWGSIYLGMLLVHAILFWRREVFFHRIELELIFWMTIFYLIL